ncbi:MAG: YtxH domain-containing protein [Terriglobia bacterium]
MSECRGTSYLAFLLVGVGVGAGLALLFAPKSGKDTRKYLSRRAEDGREYMTTLGKEIRKQAEDVVGKGKDLAARLT